MSEINDRMVQTMKEKRIGTQMIATHLHRPLTTVCRWVNGPTSIPADSIIGISETLEVNPVWLLTGKGPKDIDAEEAPSFSESELELIRLYRSIDLEGQTKVLAVSYQQRDRLLSASKQETIA